MQLNNRPYSHWREGLTVRDVLDENHFTWPKLVVKVNKTLIWPEDYNSQELLEGDNLEVIHLLGGG